MPALLTPRMRFLHVPKTGGTWVEQALVVAGVPVEHLDRPDGAIRGSHATLRSTADHGDRFTVAFVRHPLDWWRSAWAHRMRRGWNDAHEIDSRARSDDFNTFALQVVERLPGHLEQRFTRYVGPPEDPITFIGRFERLVDDLVCALRIAGESFDESALRGTPVANANNYDVAPAAYRPEVAAAIEASERAVIERFYSGPPGEWNPIPSRAESRATASRASTASPPLVPSPVVLGARRALAAAADRLAPWPYAIDLGHGVVTPIRRGPAVNRHEQRRRWLMGALAAHAGGSLEGLRILDLGCSAGLWSLAALEAGCAWVTGVDNRPEAIVQAGLVLAARGIDASRYLLRVDDVLTAELGDRESFDLVLCLGLVGQVDDSPALLRRAAGWARDAVLVDGPRSRLSVPPEPGFGGRMLPPRFTSWVGADDYAGGERGAVLWTRSP